MVKPTFTNITTGASGFWVLLRTDKIMTFATFKNASDLLEWYEDCTVSEGEEGRKFSDNILAWCQPYHELSTMAQAEEEERQIQKQMEDDESL